MPLAALIPLSAEDLVVCDFDATISLIDSGLAMINSLNEAAAAQAWEDEMIWRRGEINSMECLRRQWGLFHRTPEEVWAFVDSLEMDEGFWDLLALIRERDAGLAILSDGLSFYMDRMFARHGLRTCADDAGVRSPECLLRFTNSARVTPTGIEIEFPYANECGQCGNCKTEHLFRLRPGFRRTIYVGDGHSDLCAARFADVIFAKDALAEDCRQSGRPYCPFTTLTDVVSRLARRSSDCS